MVAGDLVNIFLMRFLMRELFYHLTNPEEGAILPLGGAAANGVHKGFGLLLLSDIRTA
jgi:hypothetical protein